MSSHGRESGKVFLLFLKGTNPIVKDPNRSNYSKVPSPDTITLKVRTAT